MGLLSSYSDNSGTNDSDKVLTLAQDGSTRLTSLLQIVKHIAANALRDVNGNKVVEYGATASAVNDVKITNAATGNAPQIAANGTDTNIPLKLAGKGTGGIQMFVNGVDEMGSWQSWTPTWTNLTIGNATVTGKYIQIGKTVTFTLSVTLGSSTTVSTSPTFTLPVTAAGTSTYPSDALGLLPIGHLIIHDASAAVFVGYTAINSATTGLLLAYDASASILRGTSASSTTPMSWTAGDKILITATYEAA